MAMKNPPHPGSVVLSECIEPALGLALGPLFPGSLGPLLFNAPASCPTA